MYSVRLQDETDFEAWRQAARALVLAAVPPENIAWRVGDGADLLAGAPPPEAPPGAAFSVKREAVELAQEVIQNRDPERFALLYTLIWRLHGGERTLLEDAADKLMQRLRRLSQSVRRDTHKMRAFLRFRAVQEDGGTRYVAWFEPDHHILRANAPFFVRRFATMIWSILTPELSAHWDGEALRFGPGAAPADVPDDDRLEAYWRAYFSAIFNPARLKVGAMTSEMPKKYWRNLPEAAAIPELIRGARARAEQMVEAPVISPEKAARQQAASEPRHQPANTLVRLAEEAAGCRRCHLWEHATQTVFGEGPPAARMMMVGEQPGDQEDLAGRPFVGPAGQMLDRAIAEAGIDRRQVYVTNAVKHFKFEPRGKRRIHTTPDRVEIEACRFWLDQEREVIRPAVTLLLGASAARAVLGRVVTISRERSRPFVLPGGGQGFVTVHPSYLLRLPDEETKIREYEKFVADLRAAAALLAG